MADRRSTVLLMIGMLVWVGIGFLAAVLTGIGIGIFAGMTRDLANGALGSEQQLLFVLIATSGFQATLLLGAIWQGRRAGQGDWRAGLGFRPVHRPGLVTRLCGVMLLWLILLLALMATIPALREFARSITPEVLLSHGDEGAGMILIRFLVIVALAPLSEELFFRGWLWEALLRRGQTPLMTAVLTALPWLLLHGIDAPGRIVVLIPAAVVFSLARYHGDSVRASLATHVTNNGAAVVFQVIGLLFGHGS